MNCKQIGNYVLVCDNTDWYFDNDENGMSYFIYKPTETKYSMVMAPNSCCIGNNCEPQIDFGVNAQVIQTTVDEKEAQEWLNNLVNSNFMGMIAVPTYIKQYESVRKYVNTIVSPTKFTESDTYYLENNMYKAYKITENNFKNYLYYSMYHFDESAPKEFENAERMLEGILSAVGKALAGKRGTGGLASTGIIAFLPTILSKIPFLGPYANIIMGATCIAKIVAGIAQAKSSDDYLKTTSKAEHAKIISAAVLSQMLQCFGAWKGQRIIKMICTKVANLIGTMSAKGKEAAAVTAATAAAATTASLAQDAGVVDTQAIDSLHDDSISIDQKVEILKNKDVAEDKIPEIVKSIEKESAIKAELKTEAETLTQTADQQLVSDPPKEAYNPATVAQAQSNPDLAGANNTYNDNTTSQQTTEQPAVEQHIEQQQIAQAETQQEPVTQQQEQPQNEQVASQSVVQTTNGVQQYIPQMMMQPNPSIDDPNSLFNDYKVEKFVNVGDKLNRSVVKQLTAVGLDPNTFEWAPESGRLVVKYLDDPNKVMTFDPAETDSRVLNFAAGDDFTSTVEGRQLHGVSMSINAFAIPNDTYNMKANTLFNISNTLKKNKLVS